MGEREQPAARHDLSLQPPGQLPAVSGSLAGLTAPVIDNPPTAGRANVPSVQPFTSSSGFLGPPVVQLPPTTDPVFTPPVIERPVANTVQPPIRVDPLPAEVLRPTVEHPFRPSMVPHQATEYAPDFWSGAWQTRTS